MKTTMMKKMMSLLLAALMLIMPFAGASAATLPERLAAIEAELGLSGEGSLAERIAAAEAAVGLVPAEGAGSADRIAALERDLGFGSGSSSEGLGIPLTTLDPFRATYVSTYFNPSAHVDTYGGEHTSTIFPECSFGFDDNVIEYLLNGEYRILNGVLFIPKRVMSNIEVVDMLSVHVLVYGDDRLIYSMPSMTLKDEPLPVSIDVTGVKFLRIEFVDATVLSGPYIVLGDAELVK